MSTADVSALIERLQIAHYLGDDAKARLPEWAADLIHLLRQERKEAAAALQALSLPNGGEGPAETAIKPLEEAVIDRAGQVHSDIQYLISLVENLVEASGESLDEDTVLFANIKASYALISKPPIPGAGDGQ